MTNRARRQSGLTLIEMLIYIAVLVVVLDVAYAAFYRCQRNAVNLRRNADDIVRALHAGERWREDVRAAVAMPEWRDGALHIRQAAGEVTYSFADGSIWKNRSLVLGGVKNSRMQSDAGKFVTTWRWEVELATPQKVVRVRPLFTFEAVPGGRT